MHLVKQPKPTLWQLRQHQMRSQESAGRKKWVESLKVEYAMSLMAWDGWSRAVGRVQASVGRVLFNRSSAIGGWIALFVAG